MEQTLLRQTQNHNHRSTETNGCPHCSSVPNYVELLPDEPGKVAKRMEVVGKAVQFIQDNAGQHIKVSDVARAMGVSRIKLDNLFRQVLGRTPAKEICKVRLKLAKQLLKKTDLSIPEVSAAAGFNHANVLVRTLKSATGLTPLRYRKRIQNLHD